jgi:3-hydroxybutyryl-CoA dehydrogenase
VAQKPERFESAAVIGSGMMAPGIAAILALGGLRTTIFSRNPANAERAAERALQLAAEVVTAGLAPPAPHLQIDFAADLDSVAASVDLIVESVYEDLEIKRSLFQHLDEIAPPATILATNTSALSITAIASRCKHPERILTTHFWNPPHLMPLVEIVLAEKTAPETAEAVRALLLACRKVPVIVKKDRPGQLGNRLQMALLREAVNIVAEGIADVEDVDLAARAGFGLRLPVYGIFEHQDMVGLDLGLAVIDHVAGDLSNVSRAPELYRRMVEEGNLGVKTGKGFYDWSKKDASEVRARRDRFVTETVRNWYRDN